MAIYHLSVKTVSRSQGRSATAAAAYRSGSEISDHRTGEVHDYTRKQGVMHSEIILPDGADERFQGRSVLWNEAEQAENRKNSTVAREYEVALPSELDDAERKTLATEFGDWLSKRFRVGVDVCIHDPHREGDDRNHHAHILTTTREIDGPQLGKKTRELDQKKSGAIEEVRETWGRMVNGALERSHSQERVDHRSHERRGLEEVPTIHEGPAATAMTRRGIDSDRASQNREIRKANSLWKQARDMLAEFKQHMQDQLRQRLGLFQSPDKSPTSEKGAREKPGHGGSGSQGIGEPVSQGQVPPRPTRAQRIAGRLRAAGQAKRHAAAQERINRLGKPLADVVTAIEQQAEKSLPFGKDELAGLIQEIRKADTRSINALTDAEQGLVQSALKQARGVERGKGRGRER